jgi:hypothetical protein
MQALNVAIKTDVKGLETLIRAAGPAANIGIARALNRTGEPTANKYLREVRKVLGIRKHPLAQVSVLKAIKRRISKRRAFPAKLEYSLAGFGKGLNLIYYQPKETPKGLSVFWLGSRVIVPKAFMHGASFRTGRRGGFANKFGIAMEARGWGGKSHKPHRQKWGGRTQLLGAPRGPGLAEAMAESGPKSIWSAEAASRLAPNIAKELRAILLGHAPGG